MNRPSLAQSLMTIVLVSMMALPASGCSDKSADRYSTEGRIRADSHAFSLIPPPGWIRENTPPNILTFKEPGDHEFVANFTVGAARYTGKPLLEELPAKVKAGLPSQFTVLEDGFTTIDEKKAYFVRTSVAINGLSLINVQHFFPNGDTMYSISFASTTAAVDRHDSTWKSVLSSVDAG